MDNIDKTQLTKLKDEQRSVELNCCTNTGCNQCKHKRAGLQCRFTEIEDQIHELEWSDLK